MIANKLALLTKEARPTGTSRRSLPLGTRREFLNWTAAVCASGILPASRSGKKTAKLAVPGTAGVRNSAGSGNGSWPVADFCPDPGWM